MYSVYSRMRSVSTLYNYEYDSMCSLLQHVLMYSVYISINFITGTWEYKYLGKHTEG